MSVHENRAHTVVILVTPRKQKTINHIHLVSATFETRFQLTVAKYPLNGPWMKRFYQRLNNHG